MSRSPGSNIDQIRGGQPIDQIKGGQDVDQIESERNRSQPWGLGTRNRGEDAAHTPYYHLCRASSRVALIAWRFASQKTYVQRHAYHTEYSVSEDHKVRREGRRHQISKAARRSLRSHTLSCNLSQSTSSGWLNMQMLAYSQVPVFMYSEHSWSPWTQRPAPPHQCPSRP